MFSLLQKIQKRLVLVIPIVMIIGFAVGQRWDVSFFKKLILPVTFLMVYPMMINLPFKKLFEKGGEKVQMGTQLFNFMVIPFIAGVIVMVLMAVALKSKMISNEPLMLLSLVPPILLFYIVVFSLSTVMGKLFLKRGDAIAFVFGTSMRNLSIVLAIAMMAFGKEGSDVALVISLAYIIQIQAAVWYMKLVKPIFGTVS